MKKSIEAQRSGRLRLPGIIFKIKNKYDCQSKNCKKRDGSRKIGSHLFFDRTIVELPFFNIKKLVKIITKYHHCQINYMKETYYCNFIDFTR